MHKFLLIIFYKVGVVCTIKTKKKNVFSCKKLMVNIKNKCEKCIRHKDVVINVWIMTVSLNELWLT